MCSSLEECKIPSVFDLSHTCIVSLADTIVARATPLGTGGIGIVRLSGEEAFAIADRFIRLPGNRSVSDMEPRFLASAEVIVDGHVLDQCLVVRFGRPRSFTGEDVVELHLHGNMLIVDQVVRVAAVSGARPADPGEFTRRAFLNGKMDLTQVEALADVIAAESERALQLSQRQLHGDLRRHLDEFRERTILLLARLELELDFVEEGYAFVPPDELAGLITDLRSFAADLLSGLESAQRLRRGPRILLLGRPNAGKSSLFNALLGYSRAIVSPLAGTTRDYLEERIVHDGVLFHFIDTAGLRRTEDELESIGISKAEDLTAMCDHILFLVDATSTDVSDARATVESLRARTAGVPVTPVLTKIDCGDAEWLEALRTSMYDVSSIRGVLEFLSSTIGIETTERLALLNERQAALLSTIVGIIDGIPEIELLPTELLSTELRSLLRPLSELTGAIVNEDVLNEIFGSFCIGK